MMKFLRGLGLGIAGTLALSVALAVAQPAGNLISFLFAGTFPRSGVGVGFPDSGNLMQGARVYDTDTGGGVQNTLGVSIRKGASGGSVEGGTSTDPLRVDTTGT